MTSPLHTRFAPALARYAETADWGEEAAIRVLLAQGHWPRTAGFTSHLTIHEGHLTGIDWPAITHIPDHAAASSGEQAVLRLACHLAGHLPTRPGEAWTIAGIVSELDPTTSLLASRAVAMAAVGPDAVGPLT